MKETPPVLTAGPAAWIRDRGRKRSRLLAPRPAGLGSGARPSPRAPPAPRFRGRARDPPRHLGSPEVRGGVPGDLEARVSPTPASQAGGRSSDSPASRPGGAGSCVTRSPIRRPAPHAVWEDSAPPAASSAPLAGWLGVGRPAPHLDTLASRGGPRHIRRCNLKRGARVGGRPSWLGSERRVKCS